MQVLGKILDLSSNLIFVQPRNTVPEDMRSQVLGREDKEVQICVRVCVCAHLGTLQKDTHLMVNSGRHWGMGEGEEGK